MTTAKRDSIILLGTTSALGLTIFVCASLGAAGHRAVYNAYVQDNPKQWNNNLHYVHASAWTTFAQLIGVLLAIISSVFNALGVFKKNKSYCNLHHILSVSGSAFFSFAFLFVCTDLAWLKGYYHALDDIERAINRFQWWGPYNATSWKISAFILPILTIILVYSNHYFQTFTNALEGPSPTQYLSQWLLFGRSISQRTFHYVRTFSRLPNSPSVVLCRKVGDAYFRELNWPLSPDINQQQQQQSLASLALSIQRTLGISTDIVKIIKNSEVAVVSDEDVQRIRPGDKLDISFVDNNSV